MKDVEILVVSEREEMPCYSTEEAAGADIRACLKAPMVIKPGEFALIPTGLFFEIPSGYEVQIRPRSGLALKGLTVLNSPGTIDADYRGEIKIILINHGKEEFVVTHDMRIAQCVVAPVVQARFVKVNALAESARGSGGFGHTGMH